MAAQHWPVYLPAKAETMQDERKVSHYKWPKLVYWSPSKCCGLVHVKCEWHITSLSNRAVTCNMPPHEFSCCMRIETEPYKH